MPKSLYQVNSLSVSIITMYGIHIPNKGEQMVRNFGYCANKSRGLRKKGGTDDAVASESKLDRIPYGLRFLVACCEVLQFPPFSRFFQGGIKVISSVILP